MTIFKLKNVYSHEKNLHGPCMVNACFLFTNKNHTWKMHRLCMNHAWQNLVFHGIFHCLKVRVYWPLKIHAELIIFIQFYFLKLKLICWIIFYKFTKIKIKVVFYYKIKHKLFITSLILFKFYLNLQTNFNDDSDEFAENYSRN